MRASFFFFVFSALAVSNVLAHPLYDDFDLEERGFADGSLDIRSPHHDGPSANIQIHLRDLIEDLDARLDLDDFEERDLLDSDDLLEAREPRRGPSASIEIHLRELGLGDELVMEERDYFDDADELDARSAYAYDNELEERDWDDLDGEFEARDLGDISELEAREPIRHFRIGTVILPPSDD